MPSTVGTPSASDDRALLRLVAEGREAAAGRLYDRYGRMLHALAYRIVREAPDAEEVVLETFAQVWRDAGRFEAGRGSVGAWLATIARSRALDHLRSRARRERITATAARNEPDTAPAMGARQADPAESLEAAERGRQVLAALEGLPPVQRQAIELAYYEGLSQSEIAERLAEPLGTVKTRVRLGMQKLRDTLRPHFPERGERT